MKSRQLVIMGCGGLGSEAVWIAEEINDAATTRGEEPPWSILGFLDDNPDLRGTKVFGYPILGIAESVVKSLDGDACFYCAIGKNRIRQKICSRLEALGLRPATLVHPNVVVAKDVELGEGTFVGPGSILAPGATIGRHVIINTCVGIGHHSQLGDYSQVCPGARVNGHCQVDKFAFVGSNASLQPGIRIAEGAVVGANSQVVRHVASGVTVVGVPARTVSRPAENESPAS